MSLDRINATLEEFNKMGLWKIDENVKHKAARVLAGEVRPGPGATEEKSAAVQDLVSLYQDIKEEKFLKDGFPRLPAAEKLAWLKNIVSKPEYVIRDTEFGSSISGRDTFAVRALTAAYKDPSPELHKYATEKLKTIVLTEKSNLINKDTITRFIDELVYLEDLPQPFAVTEETLLATSTTVKSFLFNWGGNIYVIGYQRIGKTVYTLVDCGERRYRTTILKLLKDNGIEPANIERILLTHHHFDHSGLLDVLCMVSGARVLVHPDFKGDSIELDLSRFGKYIEWLPAATEDRTRNIGNIPFSILGEPLDIGEGARLEVLGLPGGDEETHTVDQLAFFYTPKNSPVTLAKIGDGFRPTDEILFSGDLWLVHPPGFFEDNMRGMITADLIRERRRRIDFRPQNRREKDALKIGFSIITVKPGHGPEFLGSRILGNFLARRDLTVKLGFDENDKKESLGDPKFATRIKQLQESAYRNFIAELKLWLKPMAQNGFGYTADDVAGFLLRIYKEQTGGGELVGQDRRERRIDLKQKLAALKSDSEQSAELHDVAEKALVLIEKVV